MKLNALKGMRDILPEEQKIRDFIQGKILETYTASGFERISTPILEDSVNIAKSEGGENLNLVFNVLKRGEKLDSALKEKPSAENLSDMALRYDLTLPLARFFAANKNRLQFPFKVIQTDRGYRAERPQKGRLREFVQCDIDILGDKSPNAEVELIDVTSRAMLKIGFNDFSINVNDRRLLREMLVSMGFSPDSIEPVFLTFDKLDKIGGDGGQAELLEKNFNEKVQENVAPDLREMGLKVISFNVQNFQEDKQVIENLGAENISKISKEASIARAEADKEIEIAKANANKEAMDIKLKTEQDIAEKENALAIKKAELKVKADTEKAKADVTYELEKERKRKEIEEVTEAYDKEKSKEQAKTEKAAKKNSKKSKKGKKNKKDKDRKSEDKNNKKGAKK